MASPWEGKTKPPFVKYGLKIRTCFVLLNYLLGALGLCSLILSEIFPVTLSALLLLALALCCALESKKIIPIAPLVPFSISKAGMVIAPLLYFVLQLPPLELLVGFLLIVFFSRFIFKTEINDYLYGYLIAIVCLMLGAIYIRDLVFGFVFLAFYLTLCWSLMFYNILVERGGNRCPISQFKSIGEYETAGTSLFGISAGLIFASLTLTIAIFIFFPRVGLGFLSLRTQASPLSGFSETVTLGDVGKIKLNQEVVMRVEYKQDGKPYRPKSRVLWRGIALDYYDGDSWTATVAKNWKMPNRLGAGINLFNQESPLNLVYQEIFMETLDTDIIFTHGIPTFVNGNFNQIALDQNLVLRTMDGRIGPRRITFTSEIGRPDIGFNFVSPGSKDEEYIDKFLQVPETLSPQIIQLASDLTRATSSSEEKAGNILDYFRTGFQYSLEMVKESNESSIDEFIFQRKKGHCEYFASAMVILLRSAGIPARIINGFTGVEWNEMGNYMIVRQSHAHSWVEALIPGKGWAIYDPTPTDPAAALSNKMNNPLNRAMDLLRLNWQRYVIRYSLKDQMELASWFKSGGKTFFNKVKSLKPTDWKNLAHIDKSLLPILIGLTLFFLIKWRVWKFSSGPRTPFPVTLYASMLKRLEKRGIRKQPHWTHREFLQHLQPLPPEKHDIVQRVTAFYEYCRFANQPATQNEKTAILRSLRQL